MSAEAGERADRDPDLEVEEETTGVVEDRKVI
jgi:hypothetical protein